MISSGVSLCSVIGMKLFIVKIALFFFLGLGALFLFLSRAPCLGLSWIYVPTEYDLHLDLQVPFFHL